MWAEKKTKEFKKLGSKGKVALRRGENNFIIEDVENNTLTLNSLNNFIEQKETTIEKPTTNRLKTENISNNRPDWAKNIVKFDTSQSVLGDGQKRKYGRLLLGKEKYHAAGDQSEPRWSKEKVREFYYFNPQKNFSGNMGDLLIFPNDEENDWDVYDGLSKLTHIGLMCSATAYLLKNKYEPLNQRGMTIWQPLLQKCKNIMYVKTLDDDYNEITIRRIYLVNQYDKLFHLICNQTFAFKGIDHMDYLIKTKFNDEYFRRLGECFKEHIKVQEEYVESFKDDNGDIDIESGIIKLDEYYSWMLDNFWQTVKSEDTQEKIQQTMINFNYYSNPWHDLQNMNQVYLDVQKSNQGLIKNLWNEAKKSIIKYKSEGNLYRVSLWNGWAKGKKDTGENWVKDILRNSRNGLYYKDAQPLINFLKEIKETSDLYNNWVETKNTRKKQLKEFTGIGEVMPILLSADRNLTSEDDKYKIIDELTRFMLTKNVISFKKEWNNKWTKIARIMCDDDKLESKKVDETIEIIRELLNDNKDVFKESLIRVRNNDNRTKDYGYGLKDTTLKLNKMNKMDESKFRSLQKYITNLLEGNSLYSEVPDIEHMFEVDPDMGVINKLNCLIVRRKVNQA